MYLGPIFGAADVIQAAWGAVGEGKCCLRMAAHLWETHIGKVHRAC